MLKSNPKDDTIIETLDANYENIELLNILDVIMRCGNMLRIAQKLQNLLKIFNC